MRDGKQDSIQSLAMFLKTGNVGRLSPSFTLNEVHALLGKAKGMDEYENMTALDGSIVTQRNLYYPNLTLGFYAQKMFSLQVHLGNAAFEGKRWDAGIAEDLPAILQVNWYNIVRAMHFSHFVHYLKENRIEAREVDLDLPNDEKALWVVPSNLYVPFYGAGDPRIYRIDWSNIPIDKRFGRLSFRLKKI